MTVGNPTKLILNFAWPLILGSILQQGYNLIDTAIVGHFVGVNALAAVGAGSSFIFLILGFCNGCAAGFGIPVAQTFGAHDYSSMRRYVANSLRLSVIISVVLAVISSVFCADILRMMRTPELIFTDAYWYLLITFIGIPFTMAYNLLASIIRALGDSKTPFYFLIVAAVTNIVLDLVFVVLLKMGAMGAALATLIAQGLSALLCYRFMKKNFEVLKYETLDEQRYNKHRARRLLSIALPMGLQFSITAIGSIMLQSANNALGTAAVTAYTVGLRIKCFFIAICDNFGIAMATYCGQNYGARKMDRVRSGIKRAVVICALYAVFCLVFIYPLARPMCLLFVDAAETEIIELSTGFLQISCYFWFFLGLLCVLRNSIQGLGFTTFAMTAGLFEMIARGAVGIWMVPALHFFGVGLGDCLAWVAACVFLVPAYFYVRKKLSTSKHFIV